MVIQKVNARHLFFGRLLEQKSAAVRKTARETIRTAQEHILKSEQIVSHSMEVVERATRVLNELGWYRRRRLSREKE